MNTHPQISALHVQPVTLLPLPHLLLPEAIQADDARLHPSSTARTLSKLHARMQFIVDEDQVLVLRRILLGAAGISLKALRIHAIKSKQIAKIVIDIEAGIIDHILHTVIHSMQRVELGQVSLL